LKPSASQPESSVVAAIGQLVGYLYLPLESSPELDYHVRFTLLNERPDLHYCHWDFSQVQSMFLPEIRRLSIVTDLWVSSDVASYVNLIEEHEIVRKRGQPTRAYIPLSAMVAFPSRVHLHHLVTTRNTSRHQEMVFICSPPSKGYHAFVDDINEVKGAGDSDVTCSIHGWGAVTLLKTNTRSSPCGLIRSDYERINSAALGVFRSLLGLDKAPQVPEEGFPGEVVVQGPSGGQSVTNWELDRVLLETLRGRTQKAIQLLYALVDLLRRRPSIPFNDHIGSRGMQAIRFIQGLHDTADLLTACHSATLALQAVQEAYFDHSLLPPTPLPWEHFLAIYLPLIAPLLVPLVGGLVKEYKRYKQKKATKSHTA